MSPRNCASVGASLALVTGLLATAASPAVASDTTTRGAGAVLTTLTFHGGSANQELGHSLNAEACDLDADGYADLTAGAAVNLGSADYADMPAHRRAVAGLADSFIALPHWWSYSQERSAGGWTCVPDINGDGLDDLLQLPPAASRVLSLNHSGGSRNGAGKPTEHRVRNYQFPVGTTDLAATAAASAGDLDGDGVDDVVVSQHTASTAGRTGNGRLWVLAGAAAPTDPGSARSVSLQASGNATSAVALVIDGAAGGDALATARSIGDVTGDGVDDLAVASPSSGRIWLIHGKAATGTPREIDLADLAPADGRLWVTQQGGAGLGASLAVAEDVNGDGVQDYLVGAARSVDEDGGVAVVWGGSTQPVVVDPASGTVTGGAQPAGYWIGAERAGDALGTSVAGLGDLNGDGRSDLLVGAPGHDPLASDGSRITDAGAAYVLYGRASAGAQSLGALDETAGQRIDGSRGEGQTASRASHFGHRVARVGDVDGNGAEDFAISAPGRSDHASYRHGGVFVALRGELGTDLGLAVSRRVGDGGEAVTGQGREISARDRLDLRANLRLSTLQGVAGTVSFLIDDTVVAGCEQVAATPSQPHRSFAYCEDLQLAGYGVHELEAAYAGIPGRERADTSDVTTLYVADTSTTALRATQDPDGRTRLTAAVSPDSSQQVVDGGTVTFRGGAAATAPAVTGCVDVPVAAGRASCLLAVSDEAADYRADYSGLKVEKASAPGTQVSVLAASSTTLSEASVSTVALSLSRTSLRHGDAAVSATVEVDADVPAETDVLVDGKVVATAALGARVARVMLPRKLTVGSHEVRARVRSASGGAVVDSPPVSLRVQKATVGPVRVPTRKFARGTRPVVTVSVGKVSDGSRPVGTVVIRAAGKVTKVRLTLAKNGKVSVRLQRSARTAIRVKVRFAPADTVNIARPRAVVKTLRPRS